MSTVQTPRFLLPVTLDEFRRVSWQRAKRVIRRGRPDYFSDALPLAELDRLVCSTRIPPTNFNVARDDLPFPIESYCAGGLVDQRRAFALHQRGATIIMRSVEQWSPSLAALRRAFEQAFAFEAQVNVYLTPPGEKSTPPHWDTHDLFILQVIGEKRWRLFESERSLPLERERFQIGEDAVGRLTDDFVLSAGDTLYLPRGAIHEPVAESYSVHVSVGVRTTRWLDVYTRALHLLAQREGSSLRETAELFSAPRDSVTGALVEQLRNAELLEQVLEQLRDETRSKLAPERDRALLDTIQPIAASERRRYRRREGCSVKVERYDQTLCVRAGDERVTLPTRMASAAERALSGAPFTAKALPGDLSRDDRVALCVALQHVGVLRFVDDEVEKEKSEPE